jgi:ATP-dependent helicase/nuclease subunit A
MQLTEAQYRAIYDHHANMIVTAGAGSGKTRVLVERYLALLDSHPDWPLNALVAITFTRKAAQEMRDRVRLALEDRLRRAQDEDHAGAVRLWANRLAAMDSARIDTIHGLCAALLRANAPEAGIDPGFEVLDEVNGRVLLEDVIARELQQIAADGDPAIILFTEYEESQIAAALANAITFELDDASSDSVGLRRASTLQNPETLMQHWHDLWREDATREIAALLNNPSFEHALRWTPETGWPRTDKLYEYWLLCHLNAETLMNPDAALEDRLNALEQLTSIDLRVGSAKLWGDKSILDESKFYLRYIRDSVRELLESVGLPPGEVDGRAAELLPLWYGLIRRVQLAYQTTKQAASLLDFDDLEALTRDLLSHSPHSAAIRARYQREFGHILVDEFQDTNARQWEIIRALAPPEQPGRLFVVGDEKQSIYAFRGADVSVFGGVRQTILDAGGDTVALARSFRSHQTLIDCFNDIFRRLLIRYENSPARNYQVTLGEPMDANRQEAPGDSPVLEFLLLDKDSPLAKGVKIDSDDRRRWEAWQVARRIQTMVEQEQTFIYDKEHREYRPVQYGDFALLFQSMTNVVLYEDIFKAMGLPFITVAGRGYYSRQEVWDLLNLLNALYNPADNLSLAVTLRSPLFNLSDDALLALRLRKDDQGNIPPLWDALNDVTGVPVEEQPQVAFARGCLQDLRVMAGRVTIVELLREALSRTGYLATLTGLPDGARRRGNVEKLLEKAQASGKVTLGAFSRYLDDLSAREVREGEAVLTDSRAVTLMTIHASKGLEFPVVVLMDASWKNNRRDDGLLVNDKHYGLGCKLYDSAEGKMIGCYIHRRAGIVSEQREEAERKRLLYVAATRAQDYLLISGQINSQPDKSDAGWKSEGWLSWLLDVLGMQDLEQQTEPVDDYDFGFSWGAIRVRFPEARLPDEFRDDDAQTLWDDERLGLQDVGALNLTPLPETPILLNPVPVQRDAFARYLSATHIADLAAEEPFYQQRVRRSLLHDAPANVGDVVARKRPNQVSGRLLGEIVHESLRWWRFPTQDNDLSKTLESYAWKRGIVEPHLRAQAVKDARKLLVDTMLSQVYEWIENADAVYRELPFIYQTDKRIIYGVIDVLFRRKDGTWGLVDFKTSSVGHQPPRKAVVEHAQRYHLQVGVYAAAVREQLEIEPDVYIYYIRYNQTIQVTPREWQSALERLEDYIGKLIG